ncbi:MAG: hypothetical protein HKN25_10915 [Pyrinomonadaceae bacterium]|nr:hypothetical protein [Pyrinomonadaceae bacterium]
MKIETSINFLKTPIKSVFVLAAIIAIQSTLVSAKDYYLDMQGSAATIGKGRTVERKIYGIPTGKAGSLNLKLKWHAGNPIPVANKLRIQLLHGNTPRYTSECYSIHWANQSRKCSFLRISVTESQAKKSGTWKLRITNRSRYTVTGFDVEKGSDISPLIPFFRSYFRTTGQSCRPLSGNLDLSGAPIDLKRGATKTINVYSKNRKGKGNFRLRAKWHTATTFPRYDKLKIELLEPNGRVNRTGYFYSYHAPGKRPKFDISASGLMPRYSVRNRSPKYWRLRIRNTSRYEIKGFDIQKGGDINPLVPYFKSTFTTTCS